ncbi:unnamed protein product [Closterium sp. Naga37s-1]|nr:unnamed protein product [Closterium sp. Naga37s-1]
MLLHPSLNHHITPAADDPCMVRAYKYRSEVGPVLNPCSSYQSYQVYFFQVGSNCSISPSLPCPNSCGRPLFAADDPCLVRAYKYSSESSSVLNPCGSFQCTPDGTSNHCACTAPFKEVTNADGTRSCAYSECDIVGGACVLCWMNVCRSSTRNPCETGTCMDDGQGAYTCVCPPTHTPDTTIDGFPTCSKGKVLKVPAPNNLPACSAYYYTYSSDTCAFLALSSSTLEQLNPDLDCGSPLPALHSLCIERNARAAASIPSCLVTTFITTQASCSQTLDASKGAISMVELYRMNPGLVCSNAVPTPAGVPGDKLGVTVSEPGWLGWIVGAVVVVPFRFLTLPLRRGQHPHLSGDHLHQHPGRLQPDSGRVQGSPLHGGALQDKPGARVQ